MSGKNQFGDVEHFVNSEGSVVHHETEVPIDMLEPVSEETFKEEEKIDGGHAGSKPVKSYKLDELTQDYYMFTLAPVYYTIQSNSSFDLVYQFGSFLRVPELKDVISYQSPSPIFDGLGDWNFFLQGLPKDYAELFRKFILQAVFPNTEVTPYQYWRVSYYSEMVLTPGVISNPAPIDIFLPTGIDCQFLPNKMSNGAYSFVKTKPEKWVVEEAQRFFLKTEG